MSYKDAIESALKIEVQILLTGESVAILEITPEQATAMGEWPLNSGLLKDAKGKFSPESGDWECVMSGATVWELCGTSGALFIGFC